MSGVGELPVRLYSVTLLDSVPTARANHADKTAIGQVEVQCVRVVGVGRDGDVLNVHAVTLFGRGCPAEAISFAQIRPNPAKTAVG